MICTPILGVQYGGTYHGADGDFINRNALRNAVSLGGDSDTLACITGGMAEAFYGMPQELREETLKRLPEEMQYTVEHLRPFLERRT